jgi:hypothetical protein
MDTEANKRAFKHALTNKTIPAVGSLIDFHFGIAVVAHWEWLHPFDGPCTDWRRRVVDEVGEENVLSLYDETFQATEFFPSELALKLHTAEGLKWVVMPTPRYNRAGPLMDRTWWCGDHQPTFTDAVEVA